MSKCHYCTREVYPTGHLNVIADPGRLITCDHRVPKTLLKRQQIQDPLNHLIACARCNGMKADTPYEVFMYYIEMTGKIGLSNASMYRKFVFNLTLRGLGAEKAHAA